MTNRAAGLAFQEAFNEAMAEEEVLAASETTPNANGEPVIVEPSEVEQPAVETEEEVGLFSDLESDPNEEQPLIEDSLHKVKVNGEELEVTYQELIDGYQRKAHYTQGRQEVAELKDKYGKAITLWEALESDYVKTVQALMSRAGLSGQVKPGAKDETPDIEALVEQKLQEKLASDPRIQAIEQEQSLRQIEAIFSQIENEFQVNLANSDKQLVLEKAQAMGTTDLRYVVWNMLQERDRILAEKKNLELVSTVNGRRSGEGDDPTPQVEYYNSVSEAWAAALAEEGE